MLFGHGSDLHKYNSDIVADFSSNVWYKGLPQGLHEHLNTKILNITHYPEPDAGNLAKKIAQNQYIPYTNILVTNGASEAFYLVAQLLLKRKSYIYYPSFLEYEDACKIFNHKISYINNNHLKKGVSFCKNSTYWLANPNNPDGKLTSKEYIIKLCTNNPDTIFIIDEAYAELCHNFESVVPYTKNISNLIVIKSLTKAFSIPGLRLGYLVASPEIINRLKSIKIPWSVNSLAIESGLFITKNYHNLLPNKQQLFDESKIMQKQLSTISELEVTPSTTNYFLVRLKNQKSHDLKIHLVNNYGFLIRDASNFRGLDSSYFRLSVQLPEHNKQIISAINKWIIHKR